MSSERFSYAKTGLVRAEAKHVRSSSTEEKRHVSMPASSNDESIDHVRARAAKTEAIIVK